MLGKITRSILLLAIIGIAVRAGWWSYQSITDLLSFQITLYEWILQAQYKLAEGQQELQGVRDNAMEFLGKEQHATDLPTENTIEEQLAVWKKKIHMLALSISSIIGIIVFKICFDIAFGIKSLIRNIKDFVG
jgi:hypothetical protein